MDKQVNLLRESAESASLVSTTTTTSTPTFAPFTNANIDAFGRSYGNLAFADFTNNIKKTDNVVESENDS
uniref:Uncharacterized protein n=1 Tax=Panagrolaimus sp. JU765 TaxID=591449 RepID=A0AC34PVH2_9BILA